MLSSLLNSGDPDKKSLEKFLNEISVNKQDYLTALSLRQKEVSVAPFEELMENADDLIDGVVKVEKVHHKTFFGMFGSLLIKHDDRGSIRLMFYNEVRNPKRILVLFGYLEEVLGKGLIEDERFSSFRETDKVVSLSKTKFTSEKDEILHLWSGNGFTSSLNYKISPLRQLLFSITLRADLEKDTEIRSNGTLINILNKPLHLFSFDKAISKEETLEDGGVKFVDYLFELDELELGLFDKVYIRLFSAVEVYSLETYTQVTYFSSGQVNMPAVLDLVDEIAGIYGKDVSGLTKLEQHNIDDITANRSWTGMQWYLNEKHSPYDFSGADTSLYNLNLYQDPEENGFALQILAYNSMEKYDLGLI